jgi:hypothetical protein
MKTLRWGILFGMVREFYLELIEISKASFQKYVSL